MAEDSRILPVRLTEIELQQKGEQIATKYADLQRTEREKKQVTAEYGARIKELNNSISELSREINTRQEYRAVPVYREMNYRDGIVETRRADTHAIVDSRLMKDSERQKPLFQTGNGAPVLAEKSDADEDEIFTEV